MEEQLVSFETAKLAKEKGFKGHTDKLWVNYYSGFPINKWKLIDYFDRVPALHEHEFLAPTKKQLTNWIINKNIIWEI